MNLLSRIENKYLIIHSKAYPVRSYDYVRELYWDIKMLPINTWRHLKWKWSYIARAMYFIKKNIKAEVAKIP